MNVLYLGGLSSFMATNNITVSKDMGYRVTILNTHKHYFPQQLEGFRDINVINLYKDAAMRTSVSRIIASFERRSVAAALHNVIVGRLLRQMSLIMHKLHKVPKIDPEVGDSIIRTIEKDQFDVVYAFWGMGVLPEIRVILEEQIGIPIIYNIQSYPYDLSTVGDDSSENPAFGEVIRTVDGRIHCSQNMYDYLNRHFDLKSHGKDLIMMQYFSKRYFYTKRLHRLSDKDAEPHVVFIGRTDFSNRPLDDIREQIYEITKHRIHFHLAYPDSKMRKSKYIHFFAPFDLRDTADAASLANFMTQFDACIVLFNIGRKYNRFHNSLPARFLFAPTAGIPIVMPKGYFASCQELLTQYEIGFAYEDVHDLEAKLCDKGLMERYRRNAIKMTPQFTFERNFHELDTFVKEVVETYAGCY